MSNEIFLQPDAGRNTASIKVNGKQIRFNQSAINEMGLKDHVHVSIDGNKLRFRTNQPNQPKFPLGAQKSKWRDLNAGAVVKAARLNPGGETFAINRDDVSHFVTIDPTWAEVTDAQLKRRTKNEGIAPGAAAEIAAKKAAKKAAAASGKKTETVEN